MRALVGLAAALAVAGCARLPEHIAETPVSDAYYQELSCPQLAIARTNVQREQRLASSEQSRFVGVLIPSREYERNTRRIAELKGTLTAIRRAETMNDCLRTAATDADEAAALPPIEAGPDKEAPGVDDDMAAGEEGW